MRILSKTLEANCAMADEKGLGVLSIIGTAFRFIFNVLRTIVYLIILVLFVSVVAAIAGSDAPPKVPDSAVLVVNPTAVVEEYPKFDDFEEALIEAFDISTPTRLRDLVRTLEAAKNDDRIKAVHLDLSNLTQMSYVHIDEIGAALRELSAAGKPVIGSTMYLGQFRYALLSYSDEIYLNYFDGLAMIGPIAGGTYMAEGLDNLKVERFVHASGPYKSAGDSLVRNEMSEADREQVLRLLEQRWASDQERVLANRDISAERLQDYIENLPDLLTSSEGDLTELALDYGFAEGTGWRISIDRRIEEATGIAAGKGRIHHSAYFKSLPPDFDFGEKQQVAVVYGMGPIYDGKAQFGAIGGDSLAEVIRKLSNREDVAAIVLRVDSPGGSASASEAIRAQLEVAQDSGKPVVVSMAGVAASGGYWISATADEIWAHPETITGSIGAVGTLLSLDGSFAEIGIHSDRVTTTQVAEDLVGTDGISELNRRTLTLFIDFIYGDFLDLVAEGRNSTREEVHEIAQGRVWVGADAKDLGLIDNLGGLNDAVASAASLAELEEYRVTYHQQKQDLNLSLTTISAMVANDRPVLSKLLGWVAGILGTKQSSGLADNAWRDVRVYCEACEIVAAAN